MMSNKIKSSFADNLAYQLEKTGISKVALARRLGVAPSSVTYWCRGTFLPQSDKIEQMASIFGCTTTDLLLDTEVISPEHRVETKYIPLYASVSAGTGFFSESNIKRYIAIDKAVRGDFAVVVAGESMINAGINDGDICLFSKHYTFKEGMIYAVWQTGEELSYLKRVYVRSNSYLLISENPAYEPIMIENNEAVIIGELVGLYRDIEQ